MTSATASPRVLIVKVGQTFPRLAADCGDYEDWFIQGMGVTYAQTHVVRAHEDETLPQPSAYAAVIVTGSSAMVTHREPWSELTGQWLLRVLEADVPLLGVCYGHQLLAHALGGEVADNPQGRQIGTLDVALSEHAPQDPLLAGLVPEVHVPVTHVQSVIRLPSGATRLAATARDPNHAFAIGKQAWGLQFHPEFNASIVRAYIQARRDKIAAEGQDPDKLHAAARDTDHGTRLLRRFADLALASERP